MVKNIDYLTHLRVESARFADVLRDAPPDARVPTCPDWSADDLLWHLGEWQWFWATVVREALTDPSSLENPERPTDRADLLDFFESATDALQKTLTDTAPDEIRWTWSTEQTAGFTLRRQAHEAFIHRVDAELTAGVERSTMDPVLCGDGVDEALRVMWGAAPAWGHTEVEAGATLRVIASDTEQSWLVSLGRFTGTDPAGKSYDEPHSVVADTDAGEHAPASVSGSAADLDCWLWGRPPVGSIDRSGDEQIHARFQEFIAQGIE